MMTMNHANHDNNQWREKATTTTIMRDEQFSGSTINAPMNFPIDKLSNKDNIVRCSNWQRRISYREIISGEQYIYIYVYEYPLIPILILQNIFCAFVRAFEIVVSIRLIIHRLDPSKKCVFLIKRIKKESLESRDSLIDHLYSHFY